MRIGQNPAKSIKTVARPSDVTVAVLSYIPTLGGYYTQGLDVLKVCLNSIWENTQIPYDLMVFDNASCTPVREFLYAAQESGKIQYLVLSEKNYGKAGAWNFIFSAAPGSYIAYADSDIYHHPGWLEPQLQLLKKYEGLGMITGMPMWTPEEFSTATVAWAERTQGVSLVRGHLLSWEDYWKHARSLGVDEQKAHAHYKTIENLMVIDEDRRLYIGAAHFQFVAPKSVLTSVLPIPSQRPMGEVRLLDIAVNNAAYLRFCTSEWWVEHMGNTLEPAHLSEGDSPGSGKVQRNQINFWKRKIPRQVVSWLYHKTFEKLYKE
jgi:glycosyltransferase involved in cell wall biosynthesis